MLARTGWLALVSVTLCSFPSRAELAPRIGYFSAPVYDSGGTGYLEGLDVAGDSALLGIGTNVLSLNLVTGVTNSVGVLPNNVSVAFVKQRGTDVHAAIGLNFNPPFPSRHGVVSGGGFVSYGDVHGIYDAAVNSSNELFIIANPSASGSRIYRFVPSTTSLVEVVNVGGVSGGIAFDGQDRLYVAEQNNGTILRYTPGQLATGSLTAAHGEVVASIKASYLCFDEFDRMYVVSGFGNRLTQHDPVTGVVLRELAIDGLNGYGIGRIGWDAARNQLLAVHTDYGAFSSTLESITFSPSYDGISGTSSVFRGWIAGYQDFVRPDIGSGGYARDDADQPSGVTGAVVGRPAEFDPDVWPIGHMLSLGNGGSITLLFDDLIVNGPGPDFAVFENGFDFGDLTYAEFAFVEVATTTNAWARFPVTFHDTNAPGMFKGSDVTRVDGLAGKHTLAYGTPFDLAWLQHDTNVLSGAVDLNRIAYVRITDAVGDGSTVDQFGQAIMDPYSATASMTDGFELRGVGVIHQAGLAATAVEEEMVFSWFGYPERIYTLQAGNGFGWSDVGSPITGTGGVHRVELTPDGPVQWFRLKQDIPVVPE
jgi:hypothetical protein